MDRRHFLALSAQALAFPLLAACGGEDNGIEVVAPSPEATAVTGTPPDAVPATPAPIPTPPPYFDADLHVLVSKQYALPSDYAPPDLETIPEAWLMPGQGGELMAGTMRALGPMIDTASADGVDLHIRSPYRSYETQAQTFAHWVTVLGEEQARRESAEPGHSEHQLGTTMDFADPYNGWELVESFADSPSGLWLAQRAHEFGFAMSYPRDAEEITGYIFEPWHFRYVGVEAAADWHASSLTLIEFLEDLHAIAAQPAR